MLHRNGRVDYEIWGVMQQCVYGATVVTSLFHDLLLRSYLYHCVWSVITAHNRTPEKRDNNYSPYPLTPLHASETTFIV